MFALIAFLLPSTGNEDTYAGRVVDQKGQAVVGAKVGTSFVFVEGNRPPTIQIGYGQPAVEVSQDGRFTIAKEEVYAGVVVATGSDGTLGLAKPDKDGKLLIVLRPAARLDLRVKADQKITKSTGASLQFLSGESVIGYGFANWGTSTWTIPSGPLSIALNEETSERTVKPFGTKPAGASRVEVELQPTRWARLIGKAAPPITPTDLQGKLDLKGKWVLLDFWATWCAPCVAEIAKYEPFYQARKGDRDRFEIVLVHSPDGSSLAGIRQAYDQLVATKWNKVGLTMPLVFDKTGRTHRAFGVSVYPTTLLIDPTGRVVGQGSLATLESALNRK